ncbi:MAG: polyketide synthase dehydratase domain-containing protein, partial [Ktedonobacteraceae bacterium]|nr:polyketide synthase dehydratase domain-containing protein [Ktedonobacteraceae bacterium]
LEALEGIAPHVGQVAFYSTVRAEPMSGSELDAAYWMENLRQPVRFAQTVEKLLKYDKSIFLEISPHPILTTSLTECFQEAKKEHVALPSLRRNEDELSSLMRTLATIYTQGYAIDWSKIYPESSYTLLPTYPWQHQRFWLDNDKTDTKAGKRQYTQLARPGEHPLLGTYRVQAASPGNYSWEQSISLEEIDYLKDYAFAGSRIFAESAYIEMALASSAQLWPTGTSRVEELQFHRALILFPEAVHTLQCTMTKVAPTHYTFQVFSQEQEKEHAPSPEAPWQLLASAIIRLQTQEAPSTIPATSPSMLEELQTMATHVLPAQQFYAQSRAHGLEYGPLFQGIGRIWKSEGQALADIHLSHALLDDIQRYRLHPVLLNLCFQTLFAAIEDSDAKHYLPIGARSCILLTEANPASIAWSYASLKTPTEQGGRSQLEGDVYLLDEQGRNVLTIKGLRLQRISPGMLQTLTPQGGEVHSCYELAWHPSSFQQETAQAPLQDGLWLVFAPAETAATLLPLLQTPTRQLILIEPASSDQRLSPNHLRTSLADREQAEQLLRSLCPPTSPPCRGILYAWGLLTPPAPNDGDEIATSEQGWLAEAQQTALPLLSLLQALLTRGWRDLPRLWGLTSQSQLPDQDSSAKGLVSSPLWGLLRTTMQEHPALHISGIDLPAHPSPQLWLRVAQTLLTNGP